MLSVQNQHGGLVFSASTYILLSYSVCGYLGSRKDENSEEGFSSDSGKVLHASDA